MNNSKQCHFCMGGIREIDYKDVDVLKQFIDSHGRIVNHRRSAICAKHQRKLSTSIKRARFLALLPFIIS